MSRHPNAVLMPRGQETFVYRGTSNRAAGAALEYPPLRGREGLPAAVSGERPTPSLAHASTEPRLFVRTSFLHTEEGTTPAC